MSSPSTLPPGYSFVDAAPPLLTYLNLRQLSGLSPKTPAQGEGALSGSWAFGTVAYHDPHSSGASESEIVAMARIIGDGGWYFIVADMAVLPEHRRKGLGEALLRRLLEQIKERAPEGALVTLLADEMGRGLYKRCGFVDSAPVSIGMWDVLSAKKEKENIGGGQSAPVSSQ
ncbi:hypothetical protein AAF712_011599 [Marasmius tenuissimus]|uniref:N-acetyltransferase domain-containing protein n=1 Tax=Marasmius tenuissimus TaxID=585030 RepID=A0ABR2ZJR4_9AGAR|nr:hypothetical protein PM082_019467 [Marasmius tenuissimus]